MSHSFVQPEEIQHTLANHIDYVAKRFEDFLHANGSKGKATNYVWCLGEGSILGGIEFWPHADPNEDPISITIDLRPRMGSVRYIAKIAHPALPSVKPILDRENPVGLSEDEVSVVDRLTAGIRDELLAQLVQIASGRSDIFTQGEPNQ